MGVILDVTSVMAVDALLGKRVIFVQARLLWKI